MKVEFLNPFGTDRYDDLVGRTLSEFAREDTDLEITHLEGSPEDIDYYYYKHLMETGIFERVLEAEREGIDAIVIGCCYDPGVRVARELVDVPVVGPLEAGIRLSPYYGHDFAILTDHHKAVPYLEDLVGTLGAGPRFRGIDAVEWWASDMPENTATVADDACEYAQSLVESSGAEVVVLACTLIAACMDDNRTYPDVPVINPNVAGLKMAELLGDLYRTGQYEINRRGYYESPRTADPEGYEAVRERYGGYPGE